MMENTKNSIIHRVDIPVMAIVGFMILYQISKPMDLIRWIIWGVSIVGLIEVMGLAVLPSRLKEEMELLADYLVEGKEIRSNEKLEKHAQWVEAFLPKYESITRENVMDVLKEEIGITFTHVLEDAGVYKCTEEGRKIH